MTPFKATAPRQHAAVGSSASAAFNAGADRFMGSSIAAVSSAKSAGATRQVTLMANHATTGPFAGIVRITRTAMGKKEFNQFRGKGIALHSQVITEFCKTVGADPKQRQGLIRLAKKNGEKLGFLA